MDAHRLTVVLQLSHCSVVPSRIVDVVEQGCRDAIFFGPVGEEQSFKCCVWLIILIESVVYSHPVLWQLQTNSHPYKFLQTQNGVYVCIAEASIVRISLARVLDVAFGMKVTAQLFASFVTGFIRQLKAAANALGHISLLLIGLLLCLSIQSMSMSSELGLRSCSTTLAPWMLYARIVEQNRGMENELTVVMLERLWFPCKAMCLALFLP
jgi:hypothetical protein